MAQAVVGRMRAVLGLDRRGFSTGIKGARAEIGAFAGQMRNYAGMIGAALGGVGAGSFALMSSGAMDAAAEIQRLSTLANTSPEDFQRMALAAKTVGIEQDKLSDIFKDTNDRVGEFATTGGGQMKDFFDVIGPRVGVTIKDFQNLSGPQALQLYVSSLEKAGVNQQQMTFYMEAMADEATGLVPLLRNGGAGLDEMGQKASALGAIMDGETIASFREAKRAVSEVGLVFTGIRNMVAKELVPSLAGLSRAFSSAAEQGQPLGEAIRVMVGLLPRFITYAATAVGALVAWRAATIALRIATIGLKATLISSGIGLIVVAAGELVYQFSRLVSATGSFGGAIELVKNVAVEAWRRIGDGMNYIVSSASVMVAGMKSQFFWGLHDMAAKFYSFLNGISAAINSTFNTSLSTEVGSGVLTALDTAGNDAAKKGEDAAIAAREAAAAMLAPFKSLEALKGKVSDTSDEFGDLGGAAVNAGDLVSGAASGAKAKVSDLQKVISKLKGDLAEMKATMFGSELDGQIYGNLSEAGVSADSTEGQQIIDYTTQLAGMRELNDATKEWGDNISSSFMSFAKGASSFKDMLGSIIGKLGEMLLNKGFSSLFSSVGGPSVLGGVLGALGIGENATGTAGWRGGLTAINEIGGEIVDLPTGTRIIPHDVSMQMARGASASSGASGSVFNIDARGAQAGVADQIASALKAYDAGMPSRVKGISQNLRKV